MLEQMAGQFVGDLILDALVTDAILRREPDHVLVWGVAA